MFRKNDNHKYLMSFLITMETGEMNIANRIVILKRAISQENDVYKIEGNFRDKYEENNDKVKSCILLSFSFIAKSCDEINLDI